jgi:hypothetical protein
MVHRGHVEEEVASVQAPMERSGVSEVAVDHFDREPSEEPPVVSRAREHAHAMTRGE